MNRTNFPLTGRQAGLLLVLLLGMLLWARTTQLPVRVAAAGNGSLYLPLVYSAPTCPTSSTQTYSQGPAFQFDLDNPVRPAWNHADKNIELRSYAANNDPNLPRELINYGSDDPTQPPQLATMFNPNQVPPLIGFYRVHHWQWAASPDPGTRSGPITFPPVTAMGLATTPGEVIRVPSSGYSIGAGMEVIVVFADEDSVTLRYAREDSATSAGYTVHIDNICTDANLLALYNSLDAPSGPRYVYVPPANRPYSYDLPQLPAGKRVGTARGSQVVVAIVDTGAFMDPRSCNDWWQIRPGYPGSCPPALTAMPEQTDAP